MLVSLFLGKARKFGVGGALYRTVRFFRNVTTRKFREIFMGSYSQYGEDLVIDRLLGHPKSGTFVDVGANDPHFLSNTKRFYVRGWRGVNVEPHVVNFRKFLAARPGDTNLNIGIGSDEGVLDFYQLDPDQISTFSEKEAKRYMALGQRLVEVRKVKVEPLSRVLEDVQAPIDFISVDVEGIDLDVLRSNDWSRFRPKLVCVESGDHETRAQDMKIYDFMCSVGYEQVYFNGCNGIWRDRGMRATTR